QADGGGTLTESPTPVAASSTGNALTFTYTAGTGGMSNGAIRVQVPSTWTQPQLVNGTAGYTVASKGTVTIDTTTSPCSVSSQCLLVSSLTLAENATMTITYGSGGGTSGATAPSATGASSFAATEKSTSGGTITTLTNGSPSVTVDAANGSGTN